MSLDTLLQDLNSPDARTRLRAVYQIGLLGDPAAASALRHLVDNDPIKELRVSAKAAVGHIQLTYQADQKQDADADVRFTRQFVKFLERSERFSPQDIQDLAVQAAQNALHTFQQPDAPAIPRPSTPADEVMSSPSSPGTQIVGTYEMLWDCEYCGTKKLLGVTHRHCPNCGAAQNAEGRYFPAPGEEVAVEDHEFVGVDVICPSCETPNSAATTYCINCGTPMSEGTAAPIQQSQTEGGFEESKRDLVREQFLAEQARIRQEQRAATFWGRNQAQIWIGGGISAVVLVLLGVFGIFFYKQNEAVTVASHSWQHIYQIEAYQTHHETRDCPAPSGAYNIRRRTEQRSRQVPDGQDCETVCTDRRVDQGDGSFRTERDCRQQCTTRYRTEYYNVQVCTYDIDRWTELDEEKEATWAIASGNDTAPYWPDIESRQVPSCSNAPQTIGQLCWEEREATYILNLRRNNGKMVDCQIDNQNEWLSYADNSLVRVQFTQWSKWRNKALCDNIEPVE